MRPSISGQSGVSVSVVMCTYNGAAFVAEQLQSILQQTYPLKEILVFDDASTDETVAILQTIAAHHSLIRLHFNTTNIGFTRNFEQAMLAATGDAIAITDQDDIWKNTKIEKMMAAWRPGVPMIYCDSVRFSKNPFLDAKLPYRYKRYEGNDARKLFLFNTVSGHALMIKRTFLQVVLPFHSEVMYDWWMAVVACYHGGVQYLPEVLVYQRLHTTNTSMYAETNFDKKKYKAHFKQMLIEAYYSVELIKRYYTFLRRAFKIVSKELFKTFKEKRL
ncbi:MAG: glycosyltransferase, partial [Sphingobacteriaceae bacterium]